MSLESQSILEYLAPVEHIVGRFPPGFDPTLLHLGIEEPTATATVAEAGELVGDLGGSGFHDVPVEPKPLPRRRVRVKIPRPAEYGVFQPAPVSPELSDSDRVANILELPESKQKMLYFQTLDTKTRNSVRRTVNMRLTRAWRNAVSFGHASVAGVSWRCGTDEADIQEQRLHSLRFLEALTKDPERGIEQAGFALRLLADRFEETVVDDNPCPDKEITGGFPILLTYNGSWGQIDEASLQDFDAGCCVDTLAACLFGHPSILIIQDELQKLCELLVSKGFITSWAWSVEVCPKTWAKSEIRVHAHLYLCPKGCTLNKQVLTIFDCSPHISQHVLTRMGVGNSRSPAARWGGCYYVIVSKVGSVCRDSNAIPFVDFPVMEA